MLQSLNTVRSLPKPTNPPIKQFKNGLKASHRTVGW